MTTVAQALKKAERHHQTGNLQQAERLCRQILEGNPRHVGVLHLTGVIAYQQGKNELAIDYIGQAVRLKPELAEAHSNLGFALIKQGKLQEAVAAFQKALALKPAYAAAHNNLGIALKEQGRLEEAVACYQEALRLKPNFAGAIYNLANVLMKQQKLPEAVSNYQHALQLKPDYAEAHNNLGIALKEQGQLEAAVECYEQALRLRPDFVEAHYNLASAWRQQGKIDAAVAGFQRALQLKPDFAAARSDLGNALAQLDQLDLAIDCYRQALQHDPKSADALNNLGNALEQKGHLDEASGCYQQALQINPEQAETISNLGNVLRRQNKHDLAIGCYVQAMRLKPQTADTYHNLGVALMEVGRLDEASACARYALHLKPTYVDAQNSLGTIRMEQGQHDEASACYAKALHLDAGHVDTHLNRALLWLLVGNWADGWPEFEWRWQTKQFQAPSFEQPRWDGSALDGRTLLLAAEQGLGDTLQFVRYVSLVKERGGTVIVCCQKALLPLVRSCPGIDQLLGPSKELPPFDLHAPLMSLPGIFHTTLDTVPSQLPYLFAEPALVQQWRGRLSSMTGYKIGIAWQGNASYRRDKARSIPLEHFEQLASIEGIQLVSLQKGPAAEQLPKSYQLSAISYQPLVLDEAAGAFMDTAAIMMNLDLVVTSDSAIAHLAGALGIPIWMAVPFSPDWRWLVHRQDCPWYPSMRLFRQNCLGNWPEVFERIARELKELVRSAKLNAHLSDQH